MSTYAYEDVDRAESARTRVGIAVEASHAAKSRDRIADRLHKLANDLEGADYETVLCAVGDLRSLASDLDGIGAALKARHDEATRAEAGR